MFNDFIVAAKGSPVVQSKAQVATERVTAYNTALRSGVKIDIDAAKKSMDDEIKALNAEVLTQSYMKLSELPNPVKLMFEEMFISGLYKAKKGKDTDELTLTDDNDGLLDLATFEQLTGKKLAANAGWKARMDCFYHFLVKRKNKDIKALSDAELAGIYKVTYPADYVGVFEVTDPSKPKADPLSNNSLVKGLQAVLDAMYFEDNGQGKNTIKVTSAALPYLDTVLFSDAKKGVGVATTHKTATLIEKISKALHVFVVNGKFVIDIREMK